MSIWALLCDAADVLRGGSAVRALALRSGGPVATAVLRRDGDLRLTWTNDAMAELLGGGRGRRPLDRLGDVLAGDGGARLAATVRDLMRVEGRSASVELTTLVGGRAERVWFHLLLSSPGPLERLLSAVGLARPRRAVVHAQLAVATAAGEAPGRAELVERLGQALLRLRRRPSRVALVMVSILRYGEDGPWPVPMPVTVELAERVRRAARDTDAVVPLGAGWLAVVAEEVAEGGEIALARRVLAVLHRSAAEEPGPVVGMVLMEITDPAADPDAVIDHLVRVETPATPAGGLTVLSPWDAAGPGPGAADQDGRTSARLRAALASGRFVLGERPLQRLGTGAPDAGRPVPPLTLLEVSTVDEGVLTPVRVDAPGLARALDRWLFQQVPALRPPGGPGARLVLRLQPGDDLTSSLREGAAVLDDRFVVHVPEARLAEALSAQRAVLRELAASGVALGVAGWSGRIDVPTLVRSGIALVELAPSTQRAASGPEGAALVTGLVAGLRAGLGDGAVVVAEDSRDAETNSSLSACGVTWAIPPRATIMVQP